MNYSVCPQLNSVKELVPDTNEPFRDLQDGFISGSGALLRWPVAVVSMKTII